MPGSYPAYHSLVDKLAGKVISRVVHDGIDLGSAIKEACNFAKLSRQQTIHMCAILQDYGMQYNGDPKDYFYFPGDLGKDFPNTENGYVVYANSSKRAVNGAMNRVFQTIASMEKQGFSKEEIIDLNPDLEPIMNSIEEVMKDYDQISKDIERVGIKPTIDQQDQAAAAEPAAELGSDFETMEPEMALAASFKRSRIRTAQEAAPSADAATPGNIEEALKGANADASAEGGDELPPLPGAEDGAEADAEAPEEDELGGMDQPGDEMMVGEDDDSPVSATVKPSPSDLSKKIEGAPEWEVENILSIQSAENFYTNLRKELEAVVFNENISLDKESLKKYDGVRSKIDEQLDKISEAQKEKKKLEEKETDLSDEFNPEATGEAPTEELTVEAPTEEVTGGDELPPLPGAEEAPAEEFEVGAEPK